MAYTTGISTQPTRQQVHDFKVAVIGLMKEHGLSIGHEDHHGAFLVHGFSRKNEDWFMKAQFVEISND